MKQKIKILALLPILLGSRASCSGKDSSATSGASSGNGTSQNSSKGTIQINRWHTFGAGLQDEFQNKADEFAKLVKENEGVDISINAGQDAYQGSYVDIHNKIVSGFNTGDFPTIAVAYPDHVADYIAAESVPGKYVVNLAELATDEKIGFGKESYIGDGEASDFLPAFYDEGQHYIREGRYSLPVLKSTEVIFYNKELTANILNQYNQDEHLGRNSDQLLSFRDDLSYDKFRNFCRYVAKNIKNGAYKGKAGDNLQYPFCYDSDDNFFISQCYQRNIPYTSIENGKGKIEFNNTQAKAFVTDLKADYDNKVFCTKGTNDNKYGSDLFKTGEVLFNIGSSGGSGYTIPSGDNFTVGVAKVPYANKNPQYITQGVTLTLLKTKDDEDGRKVKYAWKFLKYLTSTTVNLDLALYYSQGYSPVRESCYQSKEFIDYCNEGETLGEVQKVVKEKIGGHYLNTPCFKGSAKAREEVKGLMVQALRGKKTIDGAFADAENQIKLSR